ncbi:MAG TPA: bifunctional precorrin-2 dehydrogenase/sirohydrochlorin ferrochelatase [Euryarchaeota archaeon]|nr:siroheme synthase [archaeon BMS3Bbin15]HDL14636.1 bifunctional precorrin-2 dehydrogenase/sirohydrochlorin ferrochelatase [Euryarchaeota archaeon]
MLSVILNIKNRKCVVFGAGRVAERRIKKLIRAGAEVTVISEHFTSSIKNIKSVKIVKKKVEPSDLKNYIEKYNIILALTSSEELNDAIEREAKRQNKLVNRADKSGNIIFPAVIEKDGLVISVSTLGRAPAAARLIKEKIKKTLAQEDILLIEFNEFLRERLMECINSQRERQKLIYKIISRGDISENLKKGDITKARSIAIKILEELECTH